jgi:flagellar protein FlbD
VIAHRLGIWIGANGDESMITVTRLDKRVVVINTDLIKMIEATPDSIITLINGDTIIVRDSVDDLVRKAIEYQRQVRGFQVV